MKKSQKIWLLVGTLWPLFYVFCFIIIAFSLVFSVLPHGEPPPPTPAWFLAIFPIHFLTILFCWALAVIYIIHIVKGNRVPKEQRALWIILIIIGGVAAQIVYWVLFIWRSPQADTGT